MRKRVYATAICKNQESGFFFRDEDQTEEGQTKDV